VSLKVFPKRLSQLAVASVFTFGLIGCEIPLLYDGRLAAEFYGEVTDPVGYPVPKAIVRVSAVNPDFEDCSRWGDRGLRTFLTGFDGRYDGEIGTYSGSNCVGILVIPPPGSGLAEKYVQWGIVHFVPDYKKLPRYRVDVQLEILTKTE
jgi:hypothetical protein